MTYSVTRTLWLSSLLLSQLSNLNFHLYSCDELTIPLHTNFTAHKNNVTGLLTRNKSIRTIETSLPEGQHFPPYRGEEPSTSAWDYTTPHRGGGMSWNTGEWLGGAYGGSSSNGLPPPLSAHHSRSSSRRGTYDITRKIDNVSLHID